MRITVGLWSAVLAAAIGAAHGTPQQAPTAPQAPDAVAIDGDDIGGVIAGRTGPEAGVGHRPDHGSPDEIRAYRRDRRAHGFAYR